MHLSFWEKIKETKGFYLHWLIYRPSVRKRGESTESTATVTGTHAVREGRANTLYFYVCMRASMNMCTGKHVGALLRSRIRTYVREWENHMLVVVVVVVVVTVGFHGGSLKGQRWGSSEPYTKPPHCKIGRLDVTDIYGWLFCAGVDLWRTAFCCCKVRRWLQKGRMT